VGDAEDDSLGTRTLRGMLWAYGSYVGGRLLVLLSTVVLARLLTPADFGIVALALVFTAFLETLSDLGLTQALMLVEDEEQLLRKADSVWSASVLIALVLAAVVAALGPVASDFFHEPKLVAVMPVLGLNFLLRALGSTHYALAQKRLHFRARAQAELADVLVRGGIGIALAVAGAGVWSIVLGYTVGTLAMTAALWLLVPWRPRIRLKLEDLSGMIAFGGALTAVGIIGAVLGATDDLIVGKVLGTTQLGLYNIAYRLPELLIMNLSLVAGQVLFPAMATLPRDSLPDAFLRALRYTLIVGLPLTVGLGILAEPFLVTTFGEKWRDAAEAMQVMALWTLMAPIGIIIGTAYKSLGRADILLKLAIPQAVILVPAIILVAHHGIVLVAACQAAVALSFTCLALVVAKRVLVLRWSDIWAALWPPTTAAAAMAAALLLISSRGWNDVVTLIAALLVGGLVYVVALWLVARESIRYLLATAFPGRAGDALAGGARR